MDARFLSRRGLAAYLSCSENKIRDMVRRGRLPAPVYLEPRMPRWDREAVDSVVLKDANRGKDWYGAIDAEFEKHRKAPTQRRVS
ncbi:MAG: hypothetical protein KG075_09430 [Alphaproteobacteria bacterium]|nr:hypothetical protein [Alphaproteobacteria bacterium]